MFITHKTVFILNPHPISWQNSYIAMNTHVHPCHVADLCAWQLQFRRHVRNAVYLIWAVLLIKHKSEVSDA